MCGICGFIYLKPSQSQKERSELTISDMCDSLEHRGPDDSAFISFYSANTSENSNALVALGHDRLAIIDPEHAHQPLSNEDNSLWTVFNGEIYNYIELSALLTDSSQHIFNTHSDTECLVHLFEEYGARMVEKLRGMFAFAVYDKNRRSLLLARDRLGQKPLYYLHYPEKNIFAFASELKALMLLPEFDKKLSADAVKTYLTYLYVPYPRCIYERVNKLPPAHILEFDIDSGEKKIERYWDLPPTAKAQNEMPFADAREQLFSELKTSVKLRMRSDVPVGAFLSGGLDSSAAVSLMRVLSENEIHTFSISFKDQRFDESHFAELAAHHCNSIHHPSVIDLDLPALVSEMIWNYDEPFGDSSALPTYCLSKMAAENVKVAISGDGGDEVFCGYDRYYALRLASKWDSLPRALRVLTMPWLWSYIPDSSVLKSPVQRLKRFLTALPLHEQERYLYWMSNFKEHEINNILHHDFSESLNNSYSHSFLLDCFEKFPYDDIVSRAAKVDLISYLPCDLLTKVDRASMAHGLEVRSPFLDHKVVEFACKLPIQYKLKTSALGFNGKYILKSTFKGKLPDSILKRNKMGFGVPVDEWLRNQLASMLYDVVLDARALSRNIYRPEQLRLLVDAHVRGKSNNAYQLWAILMLELWMRQVHD